jgi:V8-like Glu-specific endopeptidase
MADLLDPGPFPYHKPVARDLHLALAQLYPSGKAAVFAAQKAGVAAHMINGDQAPYLVWKDILDTAGNGGLVGNLITVAKKEWPHSGSTDLFDALLANRTPPTPTEPRAQDGTPGFRHGADDVTEPEALLFHDDLTLPAGRLDRLIAALTALRAHAASVCRLEVRCALGVGSGTGFRIAADLLLTNWHVLFPEKQNPTGVTATFGYEDSASGQLLAGTAVECEVASIKFSQADDWGVIRASAPLPLDVPILSLTAYAVPSYTDSAFIVQHPSGQRKRIAYARNRVTFVNDQVVQYLSDTQVGSSGSPVFDWDGRLIALHHAGGRPQEVAGQAPLKKNEGIRITRVIEGLQAAGLQL